MTINIPKLLLILLLWFLIEPHNLPLWQTFAILVNLIAIDYFTWNQGYRAAAKEDVDRN